ncbi:MAG TPA: hypothetical protein PKA00_03290 [Saprospiraceae bacterium]|nr:hypothetical protein [Saprospiraceae bacterium]HMQ81900.1 hypothetical protein [Saprospiraceae bacterium]
MKNNKFPVLLAKLSPEEVKAFSKYAKALYGNYDVALKLFEYFRGLHPNLEDDKKMSKEKVIQKVLGTDAENAEKRILNESSRLYKWLEEFLLLEKLRQKDSPRRDIMIAEILKERQLSHLFSLYHDRVNQAYEKEPPKDIWSIADRLYLQHLWYYYSDPQEGLHTKDQAVIRRMMEQTDAFYMAAKLQYGAELHSRMNMMQESYDPILFWDAIKDLVGFSQETASNSSGEEPPFTSPPSTPLHQALWLTATLMENKDKNAFHDLEAFFKKNYPLFSLETQYILHGSLINFISDRLKQNDYGWMDILFQLYDLGLDTQVLFEEGLISSMRFLNIVNLACYLEKIETARHFIDKWSPYLRPNLKETTVKVADALILFAQKKYSSVLELLQELKEGQKDHKDKYSDAFLEVRIRSLVIMAMTEEGEDVWDQCRNLKDFLKRNKTLSPKTIAGFNNFQKLLKRILMPDKDKDGLLADIESSKPIFNKSWLLKKLRERMK